MIRRYLGFLVLRKPRPARPELVVLCDVSGSVAGFSHFTLLLVHALRQQFSRVRVFAFIDTSDEVVKGTLVTQNGQIVHPSLSQN